MTHEEFIQEYNMMIQPNIDEMGNPIPLEELTPDVLIELMVMLKDMMQANVGSIVNFDFIGNKGHIQLIENNEKEA